MKLKTKLPAGLVVRPPDPVAVAAQSTEKTVASLQAGLDNVRNEVAALAGRLETRLDNLASQQVKNHEENKARLAQAMQKRPMNFDIKRDSSGNIQAVVARPA